MIARNDIKGFTFSLFNYFIEIVWLRHFWNIQTIAINKARQDSKTFYLIDRVKK